MPTIIIDGKTIEVDAGATVIQAAEKLGIEIPRYCYHPGLSIVGQCRICLVEIEKMPKPQVACYTPVTDGMVVHTQSSIARCAIKRANAGCKNITCASASTTAKWSRTKSRKTKRSTLARMSCSIRNAAFSAAGVCVSAMRLAKAMSWAFSIAATMRNWRLIPASSLIICIPSTPLIFARWARSRKKTFALKRACGIWRQPIRFARAAAPAAISRCTRIPIARIMPKAAALCV
ncbi:hypothetical protein DCC62_07680 [candidate division KSB1 bacterium]|nr:MAG: hypothetical protein DCC62_07680 [candidate division KSB1 bacterium]